MKVALKAATSAKLLLAFAAFSSTFLLVCGDVISSEIVNEPTCYAVLSDGVLRDLDNVCEGARTAAPTSSVEVPERSHFEAAFNSSREAYCEALVEGVSPSIALEEAVVAARLYFEVNGMDGNSFQSQLATRQRSLNRTSC